MVPIRFRGLGSNAAQPVAYIGVSDDSGASPKRCRKLKYYLSLCKFFLGRTLINCEITDADDSIASEDEEDMPPSKRPVNNDQ